MGSRLKGGSHFLRHLGLKAWGEGFLSAHRALSGYLNKHCLLFGDNGVYKTYLHCMKKAALNHVSDMRDMLHHLQGRQPPPRSDGPLGRLMKLLINLPGYARVIESSTEKVKTVENEMKFKRFQLDPMSAEHMIETVVNGCTISHHRTIRPGSFLIRDGKLLTYSYPYYGGPLKGGGVFRRFQTPFTVKPSYYQRYEDVEAGADDLMGLLGGLGLPRKKSGFAGFGGGNRVKTTEAVRDSNGRDHIYDIVQDLPLPEAILLDPKVWFRKFW